MKIIDKEIIVRYKASIVVGLSWALFQWSLENLVTEVERFHYVVTPKTWIMFILLIILATAIGRVFLWSINTEKKTRSRTTTLLVSFLLGLAHMMIVDGVFVVIVASGHLFGWSLGQYFEIIFSVVLVVVVFVIVLMLLRWIYALAVKRKDILVGISVSLIVGFVALFLIWIPLLFSFLLNGPEWSYVVPVLLFSFLVGWISILFWYSLTVPYFRNIFRRPSTRELTVIEKKRREQILLIIVVILISAAVLVVNLYFSQIYETVMRAIAD